LNIHTLKSDQYGIETGVPWSPLSPWPGVEIGVEIGPIWD